MEGTRVNDASEKPLRPPSDEKPYSSDTQEDITALGPPYQADNEIWFRKSPEDAPEGPFREFQIQQWYRGGFFSSDTEFRFNDGRFISLANLRRQNGPACPFNMLATNGNLFEQALNNVNEKLKKITATHEDVKANCTEVNDRLSAVRMENEEMKRQFDEMRHDFYATCQEMAMIKAEMEAIQAGNKEMKVQLAEIQKSQAADVSSPNDSKSSSSSDSVDLLECSEYRGQTLALSGRFWKIPCSSSNTQKAPPPAPPKPSSFGIARQCTTIVKPTNQKETSSSALPMAKRSVAAAAKTSSPTKQSPLAPKTLPLLAASRRTRLSTEEKEKVDGLLNKLRTKMKEKAFRRKVQDASIEQFKGVNMFKLACSLCNKRLQTAYNFLIHCTGALHLTKLRETDGDVESADVQFWLALTS